jgi:RNA-directed DNA polymerase
MAGNLIVQLNPGSRGWADFHRHSASKRTLQKVDNALYQAVWRWAKRRHPHKNRRWIAQQYYPTRGTRHWVFHGSTVDTRGKVTVHYLHKAVDTPIRRHTKIKAAANPYAPAWEVYCEERLGVQREANLRGRRRLLYLWQEQPGICPVCQQKITKLTGWHSRKTPGLFLDRLATLDRADPAPAVFPLSVVVENSKIHSAEEGAKGLAAPPRFALL